eukprot:5069457-Alexandrium_andersonii.AAC.1
MATLEQVGYTLEWGTLDAHRHGGLPQDRPRLYVLGVLRSARLRALALLGPLPEHSRLKFVDVLAPKVAGESMERLPPPTARCARSNAALAVARLPPDHAEDWAVAETTSFSRGGEGGPPPKPRLPCLTKAFSRGPWLGSRGRHATLAECARAQGHVAAGK